MSLFDNLRPVAVLNRMNPQERIQKCVLAAIWIAGGEVWLRKLHALRKRDSNRAFKAENRLAVRALFELGGTSEEEEGLGTFRCDPYERKDKILIDERPVKQRLEQQTGRQINGA